MDRETRDRILKSWIFAIILFSHHPIKYVLCVENCTIWTFMYIAYLDMMNIIFISLFSLLLLRKCTVVFVSLQENKNKWWKNNKRFETYARQLETIWNCFTFCFLFHLFVRIIIMAIQVSTYLFYRFILSFHT